MMVSVGLGASSGTSLSGFSGEPAMGKDTIIEGELFASDKSKRGKSEGKVRRGKVREK